MQFRGSFVALITPFQRNGSIDRKKLESLVAWHIEQGTDGIVCFGATGEGMCLSDADRRSVAEICIRTAAGKIPIVVGMGTADTRQSVRNAEKMLRLGASGGLAVTPYYNKPTQKGCVLHYREIAKAGLPLIVYHNPGRAVVRLKAETVAEIGQIPGVAAIKESSADLEHIRKLRKLTALPVLAGDDDLTYDILKEGGVGAISVVGNLFPKSWKEMIGCALTGNWERAKRLFDRYLPLCKTLFLEPNPQGVKYAAAWLGKCKLSYRLPLIPPEEATQAAIRQALLSIALPQFERAKRIPKGDPF